MSYNTRNELTEGERTNGLSVAGCLTGYIQAS